MKKNQSKKSGASSTRRAVTSTPAPQPKVQPSAGSPPDAPVPATTPAEPRRAGESLHSVDLKQRAEARSWSADRVIEELRRVTQGAYTRAGVIGRWVWVHFQEAPAPEVRAALSQVGFHWSARRQCWQHPCGCFGAGSGGDPASKYGVQYL